MTEPLKPSAEVDLAVAKLVGIRVETFQPGRYMKEDPVGSNFYLFEWSPTTCMGDAMDALRLRRKQLDRNGWLHLCDALQLAVSPPDLIACSLESVLGRLLDLDERGPLAICEAILATAEKGGEV